MSIFFGGDTTCAHLASNIQLGFFYWWYFSGKFSSWDRIFLSDLGTHYVFQIMVLFSVEKPAHHASQVWSQWDQGDFYIAFKNGRRKTHKKKIFHSKKYEAKKLENLDDRWSSSALSEEKWEPPALWLQRFDFLFICSIFFGALLFVWLIER